jgi:hypothetical protein
MIAFQIACSVVNGDVDHGGADIDEGGMPNDCDHPVNGCKKVFWMTVKLFHWVNPGHEVSGHDLLAKFHDRFKDACHRGMDRGLGREFDPLDRGSGG